MATEPEFALNLDMFNFLISEIRERDERDGNNFVRRYFKGPQRIWDDLVLKTQAVPELWSVTECPDEFLKFLKNIVGWTNEPLLKLITDALDVVALRRLIAASGALWRRRGPEPEIINVLNIVTGGARARIWNWFDFRWVLDETELGEEHQGRDPFIINLSSTPVADILIDSGSDATSGDGVTITLTGLDTFGTNVASGFRFRLKSGTLNGQSALIFSRDSATQITLVSPGIPGGSFSASDWEVVDEQFEPDDDLRSNLRIMDDGSLDRTLVKRILLLMRAVGERFEINYLLLLDLFDVDLDDLQWAPLPSGNVPVSGGLLKLLDDTSSETTTAIVPGSAAWSQYVLSSRFRGRSARPLQLSFLYDGLNEFVNVGDVAALRLQHNGTFSFVAWFKTTSSGNESIIAKRLSSGTFRGYVVFTNGGVIGLQLVNTTGSNVMQVQTTAATFADGAWHQIIWTWDGSVSQAAANATAYIDGAAQTLDPPAFDSLSATIEGGALFQMAALQNTNNLFDGNLTGIVVYNKELTSAEASTFYNGGNPVDHRTVGPTANLVDYWRMGTGDTFPTATAFNGNDGAMINMEAGDIVPDVPSASGAEFGLLFYFSDSSNFYAALVNTFDNELILRKIVAGTPTNIVVLSLSSSAISFLPDVFNTLRISIVLEGSTNRIQIFLDGALLISATDSVHSAGSVGFTHDVSAVIEADDVEVFALPADTDTLDINEVP